MLLDYLHDAWFYWTHRLLHQKWMYRYVHYIHHRCVCPVHAACQRASLYKNSAVIPGADSGQACRSTAPSAFTGYSFHVFEALIVFANEVLLCYLFPMHLGLHRAYHIFTTLIHQGRLSHPPPHALERWLWHAARSHVRVNQF